MSKNDKAVFPQLDGPCQVGLPAYEGGITLREYAAIQIAAGLAADGCFDGDAESSRLMAELAVQDADALLAELAKEGGE